MANYSHLVITRFNVRTKFAGEAPPTAGWLADRFKLFDQFCWPSLRSQTNQNFTWLVLFDTETPQDFRKKIDSYAAQWSNFRPCYVDNWHALCLDTLVKPYLDGDAQYLVTSRIDNDDALGREYINVVQTHAKDLIATGQLPQAIYGWPQCQDHETTKIR